MGAIIIDEEEFLDAMRKLRIEVAGGGEAYKLYNPDDIASKDNKIRVIRLKYRPA